MTPAIRAALDPYRRQRQNELFELAALLTDNSLTPDAGPISDAASQCLSEPRVSRNKAFDIGREYWGYDIVDLRINLEEQQHCRPRRAAASGLVGVINVSVEQYVPNESGMVERCYDLIRGIQVDFRIETLISIEGTRHPFRAAWHIDTHQHTGTASTSIHPRFHIQLGGRGLEDVDDLIRGVFIPDAPRLPIVPLDGPLAIDFILSNYCGVVWEDFRDMEPRYGRMRRPAMQRYWRPYFETLAEASGRDSSVRRGEDAELLLPNLGII